MKLCIAGDSTAAPKLAVERPETGWGERLGCYLDDVVEVRNHAHDGESTKSFIVSGRFDALGGELAAGDWMFIQFGHNDEHADPIQHTDPRGSYVDNLTRFVELARGRQANPVLITPIARRTFSADGALEDTHGDYAPAVRDLAVSLHVPFVDMTSKTETLLRDLGPERSVTLFNHGELAEYENYPEGVDDHTHLCPHGAFVIAGLVAEGIRQLGLEPLSSHLVSIPAEPAPECEDGVFPVDQRRFDMGKAVL